MNVLKGKLRMREGYCECPEWQLYDTRAIL